MSKKIRVCLLFGGKSGEHEVSLQSAKSIYAALDKDKYDVVPVGIDKKGIWHLGPSSELFLNPDDPKNIQLNPKSPTITPVTSQNETSLISLDSYKKMGAVDVFFPIIHGTFGEDGSLQGFFELADSAYVGAGVLGSAIGMDKDVMKRLLQAAGITVAKYNVIKKNSYQIDTAKGYAEELRYPLFIKPANMGSSVGVVKVHNEDELDLAIKNAFDFDTKVLMEEAIIGREIEVAVLGNDNPEASVPGEIIPHHEFYSYEAKYIDENGAGLDIPANLSEEEIREIQKIAIKAFQTLECSGMARVDFFYTKDKHIIVNEINTLPGFTKISMYPKLWEESGLPYPKLLDRLIELAIEKKAEKSTLKRSFV